MSELIYSIVMWTARIHDEIMGMNDGWGYYNSDKKLHFIVMGIIGMIVVLAAYFIFKLLQNHPLVIAFIYALTVMIVLTFSIEIRFWKFIPSPVSSFFCSPISSITF